MPDALFERNLGTLGFGSTVDISLYSDNINSPYVSLIFSNPDNKRVSPLVLRLTEYKFFKFNEILLEAEERVKVLLYLNQIAELTLPKSMSVKYSNNLGSIGFISRTVKVSIIITRENTAFLQFFAQDSEIPTDGFLVIFDDLEFTKLKIIAVEIIKTLARIKQETVYEVREQEFVTINQQEEISVDVRNRAEAQIALREISIIKKKIVHNRHKAIEQIQKVRNNHESLQQSRKDSNFRKRSWFRNVIGLFKSTPEPSLEDQMLEKLEALEETKKRCEKIISNLNVHVVELNRMVD